MSRTYHTSTHAEPMSENERHRIYGKLLPTPRPSLLRIAIEGDGSAVSFGTRLAFVAAVLFVVGGLAVAS